MFLVPDYVPGEPYEFDGPHPFKEGETVRMYRCFRGKCNGSDIWVADRNTHNQYHDGRKFGGTYEPYS